MKTLTFGQQRGYTLIEVFITVALLAVIVAVAFPNLSEFVDRRRISAGAQEISDILSFARQYSVSRNQNVRVCWNEQNEGTAGVRNVAGHQIEHGGFIAVPQADQATLLDRSSLSGSRSVIRENLEGRCLFFQGSGRSNKAGSFFVCPADDEVDGAFEIVLDIAGRAQIIRGVPANAC